MVDDCRIILFRDGSSPLAIREAEIRVLSVSEPEHRIIADCKQGLPGPPGSPGTSNGGSVPSTEPSVVQIPVIAVAANVTHDLDTVSNTDYVAVKWLVSLRNGTGNQRYQEVTAVLTSPAQWSISNVLGAGFATDFNISKDDTDYTLQLTHQESVNLDVSTVRMPLSA